MILPDHLVADAARDAFNEAKKKKQEIEQELETIRKNLKVSCLFNR